MPGRPKNERPGARPGRWAGRGHQQLEGRHQSGALDAGEERFEAEEGSGCGALPSSATREGSAARPFFCLKPLLTCIQGTTLVSPLQLLVPPPRPTTWSRPGALVFWAPGHGLASSSV